MTHHWLIDAKDHSPTPGSWGDTVVIDMNPLLETPSVNSIRIRSISLPLLNWNIVTDNQRLEVTVGGTPYAVTLPPGYYPGDELMTLIADQFNQAFVAAATTYVMDVTQDSNSFLVTITVTDTSIPAGVAFTLYHTAGFVPTESPQVLELLGFDPGTITSPTGTAVSTGPLNAVTDRYAIITCLEKEGAFGVVHSLSPHAWHDGLVFKVTIPIATNPGDVIIDEPKDDAKWIELVKGSTNGTLTFRLSRTDYRYFGPQKISWTMELEVV